MRVIIASNNLTRLAKQRTFEKANNFIVSQQMNKLIGPTIVKLLKDSIIPEIGLNLIFPEFFSEARTL